MSNRILKNNGQTLLIGLLFSLFLISFISHSIYVGSGAYIKMKVQNIADASVYSGVVTQAKVLNSVAALNQGIVLITNTVMTILIIWTALRICSALCLLSCFCTPPTVFFNRVAPKVLNTLETIANKMAELQDLIVKWGIYLCEYEVIRIARANGAKVVFPYPFIPNGSKEKSSSLTFLLKRADSKEDLSSSGLSEKAIDFKNEDEDRLMSCYQKKWDKSQYLDAKNYKYINSDKENITWSYTDNNGNFWQYNEPKGLSFNQDSNGKNKRYFDHATTTKCKKISFLLSLLKNGYKLPNPLILRNDFTKRQKLAVFVTIKPFTNFETFTKKMDFHERHYMALAQGKPLGHDIFKMHWKAGLEKVTLNKELMENKLLSKILPLKKEILKFTDKFIYH